MVALIYPFLTKKQLLSFIASAYDLFGLINAFVFRLKVLCQMVCREKLGWNNILSEECLKEWRLILNDVKQAQHIEISRCYSDFKGALKVELHGFSDARVSSYGCCIYIRYCYNNYSCTISLVFSQSRIAPIKTQTNPRVELQATLLSAKSIKNICESLIPIIPINLLCYWSDSTIALSWIKNTSKKYELYVMLCTIWYRLYNLKIVKNTHGGVLLLVKLQASLKVTLLHGCFSRFLNCANGTK